MNRPARHRPPADNLVLTSTGGQHTIRWRHGERLDHLFEARCDQLHATGHADQLAVDTGQATLTYGQLDARANQLARHLLARGARPGDRIGLLFDDAVHTYLGMLAVLKINAAYVPLDTGHPADRLSYITSDAAVRTVLSLTHLSDRFDDTTVTTICLDQAAAEVATQPGGRLCGTEKPAPVDELCYIIYTSGSTGRPKGVPIQHASICNFVRVAAETYGIQHHDRVYQGMTIAFDFSVEEIWVPLLAGATLVPKPAGTILLGRELHEFLQDRHITALCCVPTLLASLDDDLPALRFLLVSGEACPEDLITRWHRPDRRFLNVYGPTETTVSATWTQVHPDRSVTIGGPLPTYSVVILDPARQQALPPGQLGEIGIAGIGLATGYLNRDDLTERAFIPDFLGIRNNPSGRIYRTGDLGRRNDRDEIEYHGRIDAQVKIRGYRIELTEIESVLLQLPGIAQAVVTTHQPEPGSTELAAYYSPRAGIPDLDHQHIYQHLRQQLPGYMVPAYLENLATIPMTTSNKVDRKNLPAPRNPRTLATAHHAAPTTDTERALAETLARVLHLDQVSAEGDFFTDLGANSLLMAAFCARIREHPDLPPVSMKDLYQHPTVRSLATTLPATAPGPATPPPTAEATTPASTPRYIRCAILQLLIFLGYAYLYALVLDNGISWVLAGTGPADTYLRAVIFSAASILGLCTVPILAKWVLIGRWKPRDIPLWSLTYVRFWTVKTLIRFSPLMLFVGSPLYVLYLRALGAHIGPGVVILSRNPPVCTDLLTIGAGTIIRKDSYFTCYRAHAGRIRPGRITLGRDVFVGEATVLDIDTTMGDRTQLGHTSCLHAHRTIPDGQHWHGSPAQPTDVNYRTSDPARCGRLRRAWYSTVQLLALTTVTMPLVLIGTNAAGNALLGSAPANLTGATFYLDELAGSFVLYSGLILAGLALVVAVPRVLNLALKPGRVYPLYGIHYTIQRTIARLTNLRLFTHLFGDSSYIVHYLRGLGYDLSQIQQTGSNFGLAVKHETPYLSTVGTATMVSDGLSILNADFSNTSFRVTSATIGPRNFLGNNIAYPAGGRTGENCLLATKVMVPLDGQVRENVGLLGSPCFQIPRSVDRDSTFDHLKTGPQLRRGLAAKRRHNTATIALYLLAQWLHFCGLIMFVLAATSLYPRFGSVATAVDIVLALLFTVFYWVLVERAVEGFRPLRPRFCSIYDPIFWRHERFWKMGAGRYLALFNGTPFKNAIWRLLGVRLGRRVFDDGCGIPEKTLTTIGDDCTLNVGSTIQCHSLEDGTFKTDRTTIGAGCTVGTYAFVHYGVRMGERAMVDADAFVMKGTELAPHTRWQGNPATELIADTSPTDRASADTQDTAALGNSGPGVARSRR